MIMLLWNAYVISFINDSKPLIWYTSTLVRFKLRGPNFHIQTAHKYYSCMYVLV